LSETNKKVGDYWSKRQQQKAPTWNWWTNRQVLRHINKMVCGHSLNGFSQGLYDKARQRLGGRVLERGISVGCGTASKEMDLLASGVVEKMVCYELSEARIAAARSEAVRRSLSDRIEIRQGDAFDSERTPGYYDLVYWNNALHHMPDTSFAVEWSRSVLSPRGMFLLDDYVGPNRIQFSDLTLDLANKVREMLPDKYLVAPGAVVQTTPGSGSDKGAGSDFLARMRTAVGLAVKPPADAKKRSTLPLVERRVARPDLKEIVTRDPSEAADSDRILAAIDTFFPSAEVTHTGGSVYFAALPPLYANFDPASDEDNDLLAGLLAIDETHVRENPHDTLYATAVAYNR
jgi:SAM-dependent methyltransferase